RESAMLSQEHEAGSSVSRHDPHIEEGGPWPPRQEDSSSVARRGAQTEPSLPTEKSPERTPELRPLFLMNKREASSLNMGRDSAQLVGVSPGRDRMHRARTAMIPGASFGTVARRVGRDAREPADRGRSGERTPARPASLDDV